MLGRRKKLAAVIQKMAQSWQWLLVALVECPTFRQQFSKVLCCFLPNKKHITAKTRFHKSSLTLSPYYLYTPVVAGQNSQQYHLRSCPGRKIVGFRYQWELYALFLPLCTIFCKKIASASAQIYNWKYSFRNAAFKVWATIPNEIALWDLPVRNTS